MEPSAKPRHEHDCETCEFLGTVREFDLYFCTSLGWDTVIARFGPGGEYYSGLEIAKMCYERGDDHPLASAYRLALWGGLLGEKE